MSVSSICVTVAEHCVFVLSDEIAELSNCDESGWLKRYGTKVIQARHVDRAQLPGVWVRYE